MMSSNSDSEIDDEKFVASMNEYLGDLVDLDSYIEEKTESRTRIPQSPSIFPLPDSPTMMTSSSYLPTLEELGALKYIEMNDIDGLYAYIEYTGQDPTEFLTRLLTIADRHSRQRGHINDHALSLVENTILSVPNSNVIAYRMAQLIQQNPRQLHRMIQIYNVPITTDLMSQVTESYLNTIGRLIINHEPERIAQAGAVIESLVSPDVIPSIRRRIALGYGNHTATLMFGPAPPRAPLPSPERQEQRAPSLHRVASRRRQSPRRRRQIRSSRSTSRRARGRSSRIHPR